MVEDGEKLGSLKAVEDSKFGDDNLALMKDEKFMKADKFDDGAFMNKDKDKDEKIMGEDKEKMKDLKMKDLKEKIIKDDLRMAKKMDKKVLCNCYVGRPSL